jgi:uncharacterized protein YqhQ
MKKTNIGGQAVIEGVMMRNQDKYAVAVRKPDNEIVIENKEYISYSKRYKILGLPFIRGVVNFAESLVIGMKILTFSAEFFEVEEEQGKFEKKIEEKYGEEKLNNFIIGLSVVISVVFSIGLFIFIPLLLSQLLTPILNNTTLINLADGLIRLAILIGYMVAISFMKDIKRVFQYHGAEHKSIHCIENEEELTVENVRKQSRFHKRCGTNFIFIVVFISVIVLTLFNVQSFVLRLVLRLVLLPVIAGISYEVLKALGKKDSKLSDILSAPGLLLQKITTKEPDDDQIEVAICSVNAVLSNEEKDDNHDNQTAS